MFAYFSRNEDANHLEESEDTSIFVRNQLKDRIKYKLKLPEGIYSSRFELVPQHFFKPDSLTGDTLREALNYSSFLSVCVNSGQMFSFAANFKHILALFLCLTKHPKSQEWPRFDLGPVKVPFRAPKLHFLDYQVTHSNEGNPFFIAPLGKALVLSAPVSAVAYQSVSMARCSSQTSWYMLMVMARNVQKIDSCSCPQDIPFAVGLENGDILVNPLHTIAQQLGYVTIAKTPVSVEELSTMLMPEGPNKEFMGQPSSQLQPSSQYYRLCNVPVSAMCWYPKDVNLLIIAYSSGLLCVCDCRHSDDVFSVHATNPRTIKNSPLLANHWSVTQGSENANPISVWHFFNYNENYTNCAITAVQFSPNGKYIALCFANGFLDVFHFAKNTRIASFKSNFGGFTCCTWSPDQRFLIGGGQNDTVSIYSMESFHVFAEGIGHQSFVSCLAFDPWNTTLKSITENEYLITYRFGSVGLDSRLIIWEFEVKTTNPPTFLGTFKKTAKRTNNDSHLEELYPLQNKIICQDPCSELFFLERCILINQWGGKVTMFKRPKGR